MYKFYSLYSGSSGNSTYIGDSESGILIDIGKNAKQTTLALDAIGISPANIRAIFITHEHSDHISGLRVFCNKHKIPVYASLGTLSALDEGGHLMGDFPVFQMSNFADVEGFHVTSFPTLHDARESCGYRIEMENGKSAAVCTDLGIVTPEVMNGLLGCETVLLESNYDKNMLETGPYPYSLKRRIAGETGHLSNEMAANTSFQLIKGGTRNIILGHLSRENNYPDLAFQTTQSFLLTNGLNVDCDYNLKVASRHEVRGFDFQGE